jgi:hypothetical protein
MVTIPRFLTPRDLKWRSMIFKFNFENAIKKKKKKKKPGPAILRTSNKKKDTKNRETIPLIRYSFSTSNQEILKCIGRPLLRPHVCDLQYPNFFHGNKFAF